MGERWGSIYYLDIMIYVNNISLELSNKIDYYQVNV